MNNKNIFKKVLAGTLALASVVGVGIGLFKMNIQTVHADWLSEHWQQMTETGYSSTTINNVYGVGGDYTLTHYKLKTPNNGTSGYAAFGISPNNESSIFYWGSAAPGDSAQMFVWSPLQATERYVRTSQSFNYDGTVPADRNEQGETGTFPHTYPHARYNQGANPSSPFITKIKTHLYRINDNVAFCFDYNTSSKSSATYPYTMSTSLDEANIPYLIGQTSYNLPQLDGDFTATNTKERIQTVARAVQVLSANDFAWFKNPANAPRWIKQTAPRFNNKEQKVYSTYLNRECTPQDIFNATQQCNSAFFEALVQIAVWDYLGGGAWSRPISDDGYIYPATNGSTSSGGFVWDKDSWHWSEGGTTAPQPAKITPGAIFDFPSMISETGGQDGDYFSGNYQTGNIWEAEWELLPGEEIEINATTTHTIHTFTGTPVNLTGIQLMEFINKIISVSGSNVLGAANSQITYEQIDATHAKIVCAETAPQSNGWYEWKGTIFGGETVFSTAPYQFGRIGGANPITPINNGVNDGLGLGQYIYSPASVYWWQLRVKTKQPDNNEAHVYIKKTATGGYNPTGAKFGIYASQADAQNDNRLTTLEVEAVGNGIYATDTFTYNMGTNESVTLWAKEVELPPTPNNANFEWLPLTNEIQSITISKDETGEFTFNNGVKEFGWGQVRKTAPDGYEPIGAEYTLYSDPQGQTPLTADKFANGVVQKFTIGTGGLSNKIKFNVPTGGTLTVYVKETKLPNPQDAMEWEWDTTVHRMGISVNNPEALPAMTTSHDDVLEYGYGQIVKRSDVATMQNAVDGAVFTLLTIDEQPVMDINGTPVVLTISQGQSDIFTVETGNYILRETTVPNGFAQAADTPITIVKDETTVVTITNSYLKGQGRVQKTVDESVDLNEFPVAGIKFTVYTDASCNRIATDILTGQPVVLTVGSDGYTNVADLAVGTYYVKETYCPEYYNLNTEVVELVISGGGRINTITFHNSLNFGIGKVEKRLG